MVDVVRGESGEVVIQVAGRLDRPTAARIARCLGELPPAAPLVVDFSQADDLLDMDVGELAVQLVGHAAVAVRGLGRHHLRLLRYCGLQLPAEHHEADADEAGG